MAITNYGRRILKWQTGKSIKYTLSGQWVGHKFYGNQFGTHKQRQNAAPSKTAKLIGISNQILWNTNGKAGDEITAKVGETYTFQAP